MHTLIAIGVRKLLEWSGSRKAMETTAGVEGRYGILVLSLTLVGPLFFFGLGIAALLDPDPADRMASIMLFTFALAAGVACLYVFTYRVSLVNEVLMISSLFTKEKRIDLSAPFELQIDPGGKTFKIVQERVSLKVDDATNGFNEFLSRVVTYAEKHTAKV